MTIDLRGHDQREHAHITAPDTLQPLDPDVADYICATLCRQRYDREQAAAAAKTTEAPK